MPEHCPIPPGETVIGSIPSFCMERCYREWEKAMAASTGEYDYYNLSTEECEHDQHEVGHSHDALVRPNDGAERIYSLVDQCQGCHMEIGETSYEFKCPYSTPGVDEMAFRESQIRQEISRPGKVGF